MLLGVERVFETKERIVASQKWKRKHFLGLKILYLNLVAGVLCDTRKTCGFKIKLSKLFCGGDQKGRNWGKFCLLFKHFKLMFCIHPK